MFFLQITNNYLIATIIILLREYSLSVVMVSIMVSGKHKHEPELYPVLQHFMRNSKTQISRSRKKSSVPIPVQVFMLLFEDRKENYNICVLLISRSSGFNMV